MKLFLAVFGKAGSPFVSDEVARYVKRLKGSASPLEIVELKESLLTPYNVALKAEANEINKIDLIVNRVRYDLVRRGEMMTVEDVIDILGLPLLGVVPDDENVVIATNQGEPLVGKSSLAGQAFANICNRITGKEVPFLNMNKNITIWTRVTGLFHRSQEERI